MSEPTAPLEDDTPEPGTPEPETETPEPEPEPEPEQTPAEAAARDGSSQTLEKADRENTRYHKAIAKILGGDPNRHQCPTCDGLGIVWGEPEQPIQLQKADDAERCPVCDGFGQTLTGAREVQTAQPLKPCGGCGGRGWQNVIKPLAHVEQHPSAPPATPFVPTPQPVGGQWVPGRGFIPYGAAEPTIPDPQVVTP